mmetsp:Transcript_32049/g.73188  ORF Transcript_32049/g.73188 Transcript_32049/m.73188 type:complete len:479 (+) Transcript_32049:136-1572(+)
MGSLPLDPPLDFGIAKNLSPIGRKVSLPPGLEAPADAVLPLASFDPDAVPGNRRQAVGFEDALLPPPRRDFLERWNSAPPNLTTTRSSWPPARANEPMYVTLEDNADDSDEGIKREIPGGGDLDMGLNTHGDDGADVYREVPFSGYPMFDTAPSVGLSPAPGFHGLGVTAPAPLGPEYYMGGFPCAGAEDPTWPMWQQGLGPMVGVDAMPGVEMRWGAPCGAAVGGDLPWYPPYAATHATKVQKSSSFTASLKASASGAVDDGEKAPTLQRGVSAPTGENQEPNRRPSEDILDDSSVKPVALSRMPSVRPNTLEVEGHKICWWPDCKKLEVRGQKHIVSPALYFDAEGKASMLADDGTIENQPADGESKCVKFIIMIQAKKVAPGRGGESFVKAKGRARFEVKCEEPCTATFLLSVGGTRPEGVSEEGGPHGEEPKTSETPVTHDFGETPVYVFQDEWDLQPLKANLVVSLEIQALQR